MDGKIRMSDEKNGEWQFLNLFSDCKNYYRWGGTKDSKVTFGFYIGWLLSIDIEIFVYYDKGPEGLIVIWKPLRVEPTCNKVLNDYLAITSTFWLDTILEHFRLEQKLERVDSLFQESWQVSEIFRLSIEHFSNFLVRMISIKV